MSRPRPVFEVVGPVWERNMNGEQLEVIRHEGGPIKALAGAGSGKTRALVHRVVRLVEHLGVPGDRIFCVTFSRQAANEMDARLRQLGCSSVSVQTWHAFCARVLREDGVPQGRWAVDEKDKAKTFVKQAMGYKHENWIGGDLTKVRRFIGVCKANLFEPSDPEALELARKSFGSHAQRAIRVFSISQSLIEEAQILTFDDMLVFAARHLRDEDNRQAWAGRFDYVLQDEAQDANRAQTTIAGLLAKDHTNYMIVGDPGQSIYGFRGSSPAYLSSFDEEWQGATVVTMARNYRSGRAIVDVANRIIEPGAHRLPEGMSAERQEDGATFEGRVEVVPADTLDDEARELVTFVKGAIASGRSASEICVLYRLNAQSRALEEQLLRERIPYVIIGGTNFYERKEVKDLLAYLRLASGRDKEGDAVKRCINAPFRFLGSAFVQKVEEEHRADLEASWESCVSRACNRDRIQDRQRRSAFEWVKLVEMLRAKIAGVDEAARNPGFDEHSTVAPEAQKPSGPFEVLAELVKATRYIEWLEQEEGEESIESSHAANVRELMRVAQSFRSVGDMLDFIERQIAESARNKRSGKARESLTLMSIHRSKGLEWPIVWIVGCNETILPHAKGDIEEERRLMYVAATRARDHLVVSHVTEMATRTGLKTVDRSRFLEGFPEPVAPEPDPLAEQGGDEQPELPGLEAGAFEGAQIQGLDGALDYIEQKTTPSTPPERNPLAWLGEGAQCDECGELVGACTCPAHG